MTRTLTAAEIARDARRASRVTAITRRQRDLEAELDREMAEDLADALAGGHAAAADRDRQACMARHPAGGARA